MPELTVKLDAVAALRESGHGQVPDPVAAAVLAEIGGADSVAVRLLEDRLPVREQDVRRLREAVRGRFVLEMAPTPEMIGVALDVKPDGVTLVPEAPDSRSTGGGFDLLGHRTAARDAVATLRDAGIPVGILVDAEPEQAKLAHKVDAVWIQIHTGNFCNARMPGTIHGELGRIVDTAKLGKRLRLRIGAGCGITYRRLKHLVRITEVDDIVIGHSLVARGLLAGMDRAVRDTRALFNSLTPGR